MTARSWAALTGPALVLGLAGCSVFGPGVPAPAKPLAPGHVEPAPAAAIAADANFVLTVSEAVDSADEDTASYTVIYVDGKPVGKTPIGPKSQARQWGLKLPPGNHLFRFEYWILPSVGDWGALDAQWQPTESFIRVEEGARTSAALKFYEGAHQHDLQNSREPLSAGLR